MLESYNKKLIVLSVVIILVIASSGFYIWYTQYRNWSIVELDSKVFKEANHDAYDRQYHFEADMSDEKITVEGEITSLSTLSTNQGEFTIIELDDYEKLNLYKEGSFNHEVGDQVTIEVRFEEGYLNGEEMTFSPLFPPDLFASSIQKVIWETNNVSGLQLDQTMTSNQVLKISVEECSEEVTNDLPIELNGTTCSLYSGGHDFREDYEMVDGKDIPRPNEQLMVDYGQLSDGKEKGNVKFHDKNNNSMLDEGDYFEIEGLEKPDSSLSLNTYHLLIDGKNIDTNPPPWDSYIIMNENGLLRTESFNAS